MSKHDEIAQILVNCTRKVPDNYKAIPWTTIQQTCSDMSRLVIIFDTILHVSNMFEHVLNCNMMMKFNEIQVNCRRNS